MNNGTSHQSSIRTLPLLIAPVVLSGCWTAPVANIQPKGEPRLIQQDIAVESVKDGVIVKSVDAGARTITMITPGQIAPTTVKAGSRVANLAQIRTGDKLRATIAEDLAIYVLRDGKAPGPQGTPEPVASDAKVLTVDRSYRLLTVEYPSGESETFKVSRDVKLDQMGGGEDVVIRPVEAVRLRVR
jgi:hypothetical protein